MKLNTKISAAVFALAMGATGVANAESTTGTAQVTVLETITFTEVQPVDFGTIPGTDGTCSMAASGVLSGQCAGQPNGTPGEFTVNGSAGQAVSIAVSAGTTVDGVTYSPLLASNGTTSDTGALDGTGAATVNVIGDLILASATSGAKTMNYTLTVNYN